MEKELNDDIYRYRLILQANPKDFDKIITYIEKTKNYVQFIREEKINAKS